MTNIKTWQHIAGWFNNSRCSFGNIWLHRAVDLHFLQSFVDGECIHGAQKLVVPKTGATSDGSEAVLRRSGFSKMSKGRCWLVLLTKFYEPQDNRLVQVSW